SVSAESASATATTLPRPRALPFHDHLPPPPPPQPPQPSPQHIEYPDNPEYPPPPDLTPDELARERQRKHRALVKQRKQREIGNDMPLDDLHYRVPPDTHYPHVLPHDLPPHQPPGHEPPFPHAPPGGQIFALTSSTQRAPHPAPCTCVCAAT
ncbi:hypothetical protein C0993_004472, partial [Termitomyces sp. T159_Od127]